ncbi:hypothetical protein ACFFU9_03855 [Mariniflexile ostreae]|uniref:Membrane protein YesL n=1 Tax=Mariniflexile ostreae TaxID=1520892 RepID=A0ABV5F8U6_9FLAO
MNNYSFIHDKINTCGALDFGDILSKSIALFKKTWLQGFLLILLILIVAVPFFIIIYLPIYSVVIEQVQSGDYNPNDASILMLQSDEFRYQILGLTFLMSFLSTVLAAGFYRMVKKIDFGEGFLFSDFFFYFKGKYLGKILTIAALSFLISLINFAFEKFLPPQTASFLGVFIGVVFSVYSTLFVVMFAFNPELESNEIFSLSFNLGTKKWMLIFGLMMVTGILGSFGIILCGIGILFTIAIFYLPPYLIYKDVIGFDQKSDIDKIGEMQ